MKKLLAILLVMMLALPVSVAAKSFPDTAGLPCDGAVSFLNDIGILEGKSEAGFEPAASLTRAEMATIIVRMLGMEDLAKGADRFQDVPSSHWAYNTIGAAYELGFVNGMSETVFAPDEAVTKTQAVKMLVCALGYEVQAEALGGYPAGYLAKGAQLDLTKGTGEVFDRGNMAIMLKNAVECPLFQRVSYGGETLTFTEDENKTVLTEYLKIDTYKGRIIATEAASLYGEKAGKGKISLDGVLFETGETDAEAKFGQKLTLYAKEETAVSVVPANNTELLQLSTDKIEKFEDNTLYYDEEKVSLSGAKFVLNGDPVGAFTKPESGMVTVILENGDAAVVISKAYENRVVKRTSDGVIYFKEGASIDADKNAKTIRMERADGTAMEAKGLKEWNVISVTQGKGMTEMVVSDKKVSGTITEMSEDTVKIGDAEYTVSPSLLKSTKLTKPALGISGAFYLDFADAIVAIDNSAKAQEEAAALSGNAKYGYLVAAALKKGMDATPQFRFFTEDGKMQGFDMAEKMEVVNGIEATASVTAKDFTSDGTTISVLGRTLSPQLVRFTEKDGKLTKLELSVNVEATPSLAERESRLSIFSLVQSLSNARYYGGRWHTFNTKNYVANDCKIFKVPKIHSIEEEDYAMMTTEKMGVGFVVDYKNVKLYDEQFDGSISAIVIESETTSTLTPGNEDPVGLITQVSTVLSEDGVSELQLKIANEKGEENVYTIEDNLEIGFGLIDDGDVLDGVGGKDKVITVDGSIITDKTREPETVSGSLKEYISASALRPGDVIGYKENNGIIYTMAVRFRAETPIMKELAMYEGEAYYSPSPNGLYTNQVFWCGEITEVSDRVVNYKTLVHKEDGIYDTVNGPFWMRMEPFEAVKIMEFNMKTKEFREITPADINVGDIAFGYRKTVNPQFMIIYKEIDMK